MFASHPKLLPVLWQPSLHLYSFVISRMVYNGMSVHTLFNHSPVEVLLVYSQHFAVKNKTVMNICVQGCMYISLRYMPKNELPGLCGKGIFIFIRNLPTLPDGCTTLHSHQQFMRDTLFFLHLVSICYYSYF